MRISPLIKDIIPNIKCNRLHIYSGEGAIYSYEN